MMYQIARLVHYLLGNIGSKLGQDQSCIVTLTHSLISKTYVALPPMGDRSHKSINREGAIPRCTVGSFQVTVPQPGSQGNLRKRYFKDEAKQV